MLSLFRRSRCRRPFGMTQFALYHDEGTSRFMTNVNEVIRKIAVDAKITEQLSARWIDQHSWDSYLNTYRRRLIKEPVETLGGEEQLHQLSAQFDRYNPNDAQSEEEMKKYMFDMILPKAEADLKEMIAAHKTLESSTDLRVPHEWYPWTRLMRRKIIYHGGPTNSGKTYQALKRLAEADPAKGGGLYAGPLRLLALEVYESLNRQGVLTNLSTGQERRVVPGATHASSTMEMVSMSKEYDVAVIDEIQMIGDMDRGSAWTRALLGLRAREIHVCGGLEAEKIVRSLAESAGDEFTLQRYERLSTLKVEDESLRGDYSKVQPGDCVVAFSKADIFSIRKQIESATPYKCAVIYGQLPPETRSQQARKFNEEDGGCDILVASDAIGMGLNLNIRRTVFHTTRKSNKTGSIYVEPTNVKQIAGRAGRLSSNYKVGLVTTWQEADLAYVRAVLNFDVPELDFAGIFPSPEQIASFTDNLDRLNEIELARNLQREQDVHAEQEELGEVGVLPAEQTGEAVSAADAEKEPGGTAPPGKTIVPSNQLRLSAIIGQYLGLSKTDSRFRVCTHRDMVTVANWLHTIPLSIPDKFLFSTAPVDIRNVVSMTALYEFAAKYALQQPVALNIRLRRSLPRDLIEFTDLCIRHNVLDLYLWLANRFPKYFIEHDLCLEQKKFAITQIEETLRDPALQRESSHGRSYLRLYENMKDKAPAEEYPHIMQRALENLAQVPEELRCILSPEDRQPPQHRDAKGYRDYNQNKSTSSAAAWKKPVAAPNATAAAAGQSAQPAQGAPTASASSPVGVASKESSINGKSKQFQKILSQRRPAAAASSSAEASGTQISYKTS